MTIVAVLPGGALLCLIGALLAIPAAAAVPLLISETRFPRLDRGSPAKAAMPQRLRLEERPAEHALP
ncbi:hypothetical protein [Nocardia sp. NPDC060255]|uniref:hypothetical protein n=1 Tax=Nocardia sp. NPDC060255 TaxID=3347085 RepID=UPI00365475D0